MKKLFTILSIAFATIANAQVTISPSATAICQGQSVTLVANATGYNADTLNMQWLQNGVGFGAANNDTITLAPTVGVWNYTVNVTYGNQFIGTGFVTLTVNANPTANAIGGAFCENSTISLMGGGGVSYSWSGPNGFSSNAQNPSLPATLAANGTYALVATNVSGCSDTATTQVVVNPLPTPSIIVSPNDTVCQGTTVALIATGGNIYVWNTTATTTSITATPSVGNTTFSVQATDGNGCQATANQTIIVRPNPVVNAIGINATCNGLNNGSAVVTAAVGAPFTYLWNTGATTAGIINLSPAVYTATVTNTYGCSATDTATVGQPAVLTAAISGQTNVSCNGGNNGTATVSVTGGTAPYSFGWTGNGAGNNPRTSLTAGTYTVTVTDANNCSDTAVVSITQPLPLTANADSTTVSCNGSNNGTAFVSFINGGVAPYVYVWNNGQTGSSISNLSAGNYTATITDANGCQITAATAVTQPSPVTFTFNQTNVTCNGGNNGSITVTANGGVGNYQYKIGNGLWVTTNIFSNLTAGTYTIMARDANQCTAGPTTIIITQPNAITVTVGAIAQACDSLGQAWATVSGGQGPYTYSWSNGLGTNDSVQTVAGTYNVTVIDANGCQGLGTAVIAAPQPVSITGTSANPTCFGGSNGSINITVTGDAPFTYQWSNGATTEDLTGLGAPSSLTVIVTAANGCLGSASYSLVNPTPLNVSVNNDTTSCFGTATGSLTAMATGGTGSYSFAWSPSGGNASIANGLTAGVYTATVTDANGCTASDQGQVFNAPALQASSVVTNVQCAGSNTGAIDLTVTGGTPIYQYFWTGPNGFTQISGDIWNLAAGNYTVTITDVNSCTTTHTTIVGGSNLPTMYVNLTATNICGSGNTGSITAAISGGTAPYNYLWSNNATSPSIGGLTPGTYGVIITDANGCQAQGSVDVQGSPSMTINLVNQVLCEGNSELLDAGLTGGTWPYQFVWEMPYGQIFTTNNVNPSQEGTYQLTITDGFGCVITGTMFVDLIPCNTTGINDLNTENIKLFPNPIPSGGSVTITLPNTIQDLQIDITNITGQSLYKGKVSGSYHFCTSGLAAGTYFVQIASRDQLITKKLIVQ